MLQSLNIKRYIREKQKFQGQPLIYLHDGWRNADVTPEHLQKVIDEN